MKIWIFDKNKIKKFLKSIIIHPLFILSVLIAVVVAYKSPIFFVPVGNDTYADWLSHAKQIWLAEKFWFDGMITGARGYNPGWHLALSYTASLWGEFSETRSVAIPTVFHLTFLGAVYDVLIRLWPNRKKDRSSIIATISLIFILLALAAELSWKLIPPLILSEMPLFYSLIGFFCISQLYWASKIERKWLTVILGVILSGHYLVKSQGLPLVATAPILIFLLEFFSREPCAQRGRSALVSALAVLIPSVICIGLWKTQGPIYNGCLHSIEMILTSASSGIAESSYSTRHGVLVSWDILLRDYIRNSIIYISSYKFPITLISAFGIFAALLFPNVRWLSVGIIVYTLAYLIAVYIAYLGCIDSFNSYFSSLQRYLQPPIRNLHFIGIFIILLIFINIFNISNFFKSRRLTLISGSGALIILLTYQMIAMTKSISRIISPDGNKDLLSFIHSAKRETNQIIEIANAKGYKNPKVMMSFVYRERLPWLIALHFGLPNTPEKVPVGSSASRWRLAFMRYQKTTSEKPAHARGEQNLLAYDVIWPKSQNVHFNKLIGDIADDPACALDPTRYIFLKKSKKSTKFECVRFEGSLFLNSK